MYNFSEFYGLIIILVAIAILYVIFRRLKEKRDEDFEDRTN